MRKKIFLIAILILSAFLALCLAACDLTKKEDNRSSSVKPDINTALANYDNLDKKRSDLTADLTFALFKMDKEDKSNKEVLTSLAITEELALDRTEIDGKIYLDGTVKTSSIDERLIAAYKSVMKLLQNGYDPSQDEVIDYLQKKTYFALQLGYYQSVYNLKAEYVTEPRDPDNKIWVATDDAFFQEQIDEMKMDVDLVLADYLMTNGISDLGDINNWIGKDTANKYFSTESNSFAYNITADKEKLHKLIFDTITELSSSLDEETYKEDLELYKQVAPYLEKWVSVGNTTLDAVVDYNGLPSSLDADVTLYVNINLPELKEVLKILIPEKKDRDQLYATVELVYNLLSLRGTEGQSDTIGMSFRLHLNEQFLYGEKNVNFNTADTDLFIPLDEEREDRRVFRKEDKPADGNTDNGNNDNGAQQ